jgi:hypothetical protein
MKTRRIIYLVLGCLFTLFSIFSYIGRLSDTDGRKVLTPADRSANATMAGWYFGLSLPPIIALVFFWLAYRVTKKIKKKKEQEMFNSFLPLK